MPLLNLNIKPVLHQFSYKIRVILLIACIGYPHLSLAERDTSGASRIWKEPVTGMEFIWLPGGCFEMGSPPTGQERDLDEGPVHEVCLDGFWMGKYEVTNAEFRKFRPDHNSKSFDYHYLNRDKQPVVYVGWIDAKTFANWLMKLHGGRYEFRLPTEAEWEYACRAGTKTSRFWGNNPSIACKYANVADRQAQANWPNWTTHDCDDGHAVAAPVGRYRSNGFGLYDMLGNVWEWCEDIYSRNAYRQHARNNPINTAGGSARVYRGGSWSSYVKHSRAAYRLQYNPNDGYYSLGFRLIRVSH